MKFLVGERVKWLNWEKGYSIQPFGTIIKVKFNSFQVSWDIGGGNITYYYDDEERLQGGTRVGLALNGLQLAIKKAKGL